MNEKINLSSLKKSINNKFAQNVTKPTVASSSKEFSLNTTTIARFSSETNQQLPSVVNASNL